MPIPYFVCDNCHTRYQHAASLVGHAIRCKMCGFVFRVPAQAMVDLNEKPHAEAAGGTAAARGTGRWFLRFSNGRQFGPVVRPMIEEWLHEGRADAESWVLQEGTEDWMQVKDAFPELVALKNQEPENPYAPVPLSVAQIPAAGLLDYFSDERHLLTSAEQQQHAEAVEMVNRECHRSMGVVRLKQTKSVRVGELVVFGESIRMPEEARPESLTVFSLISQSAEFYLVVPWSKLGRLAHEFVSIVPGRLPSSIALRRVDEKGFAGGIWCGMSGTEDDVLAVAAKRTQDELTRGIRWQWYSQKGDYTMVQVWGLQVVPLGDEKFLHIMQTSCMGPSGQDFGLLWYQERQSAFFRFSRRLSLPQDHETHFLFSTSAGQLFARLSGLEASTEPAPCEVEEGP
ncbi:MAG: hypothetical protein KA004_02070 [Verrucomicrobiales bacterium]|nr:hypothetical protein [Verrucomicrobiales bacterium]